MRIIPRRASVQPKQCQDPCGEPGEALLCLDDVPRLLLDHCFQCRSRRCQLGDLHLHLPPPHGLGNEGHGLVDLGGAYKLPLLVTRQALGYSGSKNGVVRAHNFDSRDLVSDKYGMAAKKVNNFFLWRLAEVPSPPCSGLSCSRTQWKGQNALQLLLTHPVLNGERLRPGICPSSAPQLLPKHPVLVPERKRCLPLWQVQFPPSSNSFLYLSLSRKQIVDVGNPWSSISLSARMHSMLYIFSEKIPHPFFLLSFRRRSFQKALSTPILI